jgi:hypothetical protein
MATIREWETEVKRLSPLEAERKLEAIQELLGWEFFKEQYDGLGLPVVEAILKNLGQIRQSLYCRSLARRAHIPSK